MRREDSEVVFEFTEKYIREYGEAKFRKLVSKVENSNGAMKLIKESILKSIAPGYDDFNATIMGSPYFMIAKKETVAVGSLILLLLWKEHFNAANNYISDIDFNFLASKIIRSCGEML